MINRARPSAESPGIYFQGSLHTYAREVAETVIFIIAIAVLLFDGAARFSGIIVTVTS